MAAGVRRKVLIVEDEAELRRHLCTYLAARNPELEPVGAATAEEALEILRGGGVEALVTDIRLPGIDGVELIREARSIDPALPVLVMTAFGTDELRRAAYRQGAMQFMEKPISLQVLAEAVERALGERDHGWRGVVGGLDLYDLAQLLALSRRRRALEVSHGDQRGLLVFDQGALIHASTGTLRGERAFYEMVRWKGGGFREVSVPEDETWQRNVTTPLPHLLMEAARLADEGVEVEGSGPLPVSGPAGAEEGVSGGGEAGAEERTTGGTAAIDGSGVVLREGPGLERLQAVLEPMNELATVVSGWMHDGGLGTLVRCRLVGTGGGLGWSAGNERPSLCIITDGPVTMGWLGLELDATATGDDEGHDQR